MPQALQVAVVGTAASCFKRRTAVMRAPTCSEQLRHRQASPARTPRTVSPLEAALGSAGSAGDSAEVGAATKGAMAAQHVGAMAAGTAAGGAATAEAAREVADDSAPGTQAQGGARTGHPAAGVAARSAGPTPGLAAAGSTALRQETLPLARLPCGVRETGAAMAVVTVAGRLLRHQSRCDNLSACPWWTSWKLW